MNPKYPVYIISKGRWELRHTSRALELRRIPYRIVIEPQEYDQYAAVINPDRILVLPFSNLGQGSIPARNWVWEHSIAVGAERHWILDDNISHFYRMHQNVRYYTKSGTTFRVIEDWCDRYENIALAGMQYKMFSNQNRHMPPVLLNTRIYSCILVKNDLPYRWRGRYNEDTDLSLRALKDEWVTALFYAFLCDKQQTMTIRGGNTDELYRDDGRLQMAQSLYEQHPDVVKVVRKWKRTRWHHEVDYRPFANNRPVLKPGVTLPDGPNNYGMILRKPA